MARGSSTFKNITPYFALLVIWYASTYIENTQLKSSFQDQMLSVQDWPIGIAKQSICEQMSKATNWTKFVLSELIMRYRFIEIWHKNEDLASPKQYLLQWKEIFVWLHHCDGAIGTARLLHESQPHWSSSINLNQNSLTEEMRKNTQNLPNILYTPITNWS